MVLSFNSGRLSTIKIDWSLYGGAEQVAPPAAQLGSSLPVSSASSTTGSTRHSRSPPPAFSSDHAESSLSLSSHITTPSDSDLDQDSPLDSSKATCPDSAKTVQASTTRKQDQLAQDGRAWLPNINHLPHHTDFLWQHTEEPHRSRRMAILKAHPEVRQLMGHEPLTKYISFGVLLLQVSVAVYLSVFTSLHPWSWRFLLVAYVLGGTANQNTFLAIHEITHNLAFKGIRTNKVWAIFVNAAIGVPYAMAFKPYHLEHHKYLGEDGVDTDLPTRFERIVLRNVLGKAFFATFQIFFYALRPGFVRAQRLTVWHAANVVWIVAADTVLVRCAGWNALWYLLTSSFFAGSLHPCAAHFIAEHYMFAGIQQETWSYYGVLNALAYNVGYHNEHHDFPSIAWSRLPALRALAPEFYDILPHHTSWPIVILRFILGDSGLWARTKRPNRDAERAARQHPTLKSA